MLRESHVFDFVMP